mmetsp:Transcript_9148/g.30396  ORF Transcript_9148/g.30396 Transcript_9148/m.30396 type:complete len:235 (+) Transcript_9148:217-921(+)
MAARARLRAAGKVPGGAYGRGLRDIRARASRRPHARLCRRRRARAAPPVGAAQQAALAPQVLRNRARDQRHGRPARGVRRRRCAQPLRRRAEHLLAARAIELARRRQVPAARPQVPARRRVLRGGGEERARPGAGRGGALGDTVDAERVTRVASCPSWPAAFKRLEARLLGCVAAMQKRRAFLRRLVDKRPNLVRLAASLGDPTAAPQHEDAPATSSTSGGLVRRDPPKIQLLG